MCSKSHHLAFFVVDIFHVPVQNPVLDDIGIAFRLNVYAYVLSTEQCLTRNNVDCILVDVPFFGHPSRILCNKLNI